MFQSAKTAIFTALIFIISLALTAGNPSWLQWTIGGVLTFVLHALESSTGGRGILVGKNTV